jgi:hypothetical protein
MQSAPTEKKTVCYLWEPFIRAIPLAAAGKAKFDADTDTDADADGISRMQSAPTEKEPYAICGSPL